MKLNKKMEELLTSRNFKIGAIIVVLALGIFFRAYNFHDWLHFGNDQARDAQLVKDVVDGKTGWPLLGSPMGNTKFRLGPIYNYFQIIAVKIFGNSPEKLAYPDLFASIFSIPLLYLLLKRYFSKNLSLSLAGLYAVSYYSIEFARFGWNSNPMPFFVILFILSLLEFVYAGTQAKWLWVILLGISLGVGVQLHAILLLIMLGTVFFSLLVSVKRDWHVLNKWAVVFVLAFLLNVPMLISEQKSNYADTKIFLASFTDKSDSGSSRLVRDLELNLACHAQANSLILTSIGNKENCDFLYSKARNVKAGSKLQLPTGKPLSMLGIFLSSVLVAGGYVLLLYAAWKEQDRKKKYFLGLVALYSTLSFCVMLPIIDQAPMRYFIQVIFVPFVLLGVTLDFLAKNYAKLFIWVAIGTFGFFALSNFNSLFAEGQRLADKTRGDSGYVVLDEVQPLVNFMATHSGQAKEAYLFGGAQYYSPYNKPLIYLANEQGLSLKRGTDLQNIAQGQKAFYIGQSLEDGSAKELKGMQFSDHLDVGQLGIYELAH